MNTPSQFTLARRPWPWRGWTLVAGLYLSSALHAQDKPAPDPGTTEVFTRQAGAGVREEKGSWKPATVEQRRAHVDKEFLNSMGLGGGARTLVVPPPDTDGEKLARLEEDLAVMSRIFDKALDKKGARRGNEFRVFFNGNGSPGDFDSLYLDGYGAVFLLSVDFPLIEPAKPEKTKKESSEDQDKTWEQARREVQGGKQGGFSLATDEEDDDGEAPEFDGAKVTELKRQVIGALKHASNLSAVKSGEAVTVVVFGRGNVRGHRTTVDLYPARPGAAVWGTAAPLKAGAERRRPQLILRAQKSDIDAFAKGRLSADEFARKVSATSN